MEMVEATSEDILGDKNVASTESMYKCDTLKVSSNNVQVTIRRKAVTPSLHIKEGLGDVYSDQNTFQIINEEQLACTRYKHFS